MKATTLAGMPFHGRRTPKNPSTAIFQGPVLHPVMGHCSDDYWITLSI